MSAAYLLHAGHLANGIEFYMLGGVVLVGAGLVVALSWPKHVVGTLRPSRVERRAKRFD